MVEKKKKNIGASENERKLLWIRKPFHVARKIDLIKRQRIAQQPNSFILTEQNKWVKIWSRSKRIPKISVNLGYKSKETLSMLNCTWTIFTRHVHSKIIKKLMKDSWIIWQCLLYFFKAHSTCRMQSMILSEIFIQEWHQSDLANSTAIWTVCCVEARSRRSNF